MKKAVLAVLAVLALGGCFGGKPLGGLTVTTQPMTQDEILLAMDTTFRSALRVGLRLNEEKALKAFGYTRDGLLAIKAINKDVIPLSDLSAIVEQRLAAVQDKQVAMILGDILFISKPWLMKAAIERTDKEAFLSREFVQKLVDNGLIALAEAAPKTS